MNRLVIVAFMIFSVSGNSIASDLAFSNSKKKSKDDYGYSKCIDVSTSYREKLTYEEICKYGVSCPNEKSQKKVTMYCMESNLSECFVYRSWKSPNQLVGIPDSTEIGLLTQGLSFKQGAKSGKTCAYYDQ